MRILLAALILAGCASAPTERPAIWRCYRVEDSHVDETMDCVCGDKSMRCWIAQ